MKGFSLIETFVAITILLVVVIGPLGLISRSIQDGSLAKNRVVAYYLAQAKMEELIGNLKINFDDQPDACVTNFCDYEFSISDHPGVANGLFEYKLSVDEEVIGVSSEYPDGQARLAQLGVVVQWRERFLPLPQKVTVRNFIYKPIRVQDEEGEEGTEEDI